jgi:predicted NBD/HSP70 family sugar kinase
VDWEEPDRTVVGIDIGGTKTAAVALRLSDGAVRYREVIPTWVERGAADLKHRLALCLAQMAEQLELTAPGRVGVAVPELVDLDGLITTEAVMPGLAGDLRRAWADLGVVQVESDTRAAATAEAHLGAGQGFASMVHVSIGTGISSTFVIDGIAWRGAHGAAILLGSSTLAETADPHTGTAMPFVLEDVASGAALARRYRAAGGQAENAEEVLACYKTDSLAAHIVDDAGRAAGLGIALLVNLLDPAAVVLGGGLGSADGPYWQAVEAAARAAIWAPAARTVPLLRSALGPDAAAIGAAFAAADAQPAT